MRATNAQARYFSVIASPLRPAFAISPTCRRLNSSTGPFWLVSDRARAAADGEAGACGAVDARYVGRPFDIADPAAQHRLRSAEHEAVVQSAGRGRKNSGK
jgi:hypothetical protein